MDFDQPTDFVSVVFHNGSGLSVWSGFGIITAFDAMEEILGSASTALMEPPDGGFLVDAPADFSWPVPQIDHILVSETTLTGADFIRVRTVAFNVAESTVGLLFVGVALFGSFARRARLRLGVLARTRAGR